MLFIFHFDALKYNSSHFFNTMVILLFLLQLRNKCFDLTTSLLLSDFCFKPSKIRKVSFLLSTIDFLGPRCFIPFGIHIICNILLTYSSPSGTMRNLYSNISYVEILKSEYLTRNSMDR